METCNVCTHEYLVWTTETNRIATAKKSCKHKKSLYVRTRTLREYKYILKFLLKQIQMDYETKDADISNLLSEFFELDAEKNELCFIPDCIETLSHFPFLSDNAIRGVKLSELYKLLSAAHASSEEIEQIRVRRRRLQKSHFKQKYDRQGREAFGQLKSSLSLLRLQKEQLTQLKDELEDEINFYEEKINTNN